MKTDHEFFARCASGFEKTLASELKSLDLGRVRPLKGGVAFFGTVRDGYRACLWSRVATRIQLVLVRVGSRDANDLYQGAYGFAWENHVPRSATIAVNAHGTNANLRKTTFTALKVKDALCDRLRDKRGFRPNVDPHSPSFAVDVALHEQKATLYLNLSGESLHRRGYREDGVQTEAPLKETLAAGMLLAAGWPKLATQGGCMVDPMCGSGTLTIEAALIASHTAPGLQRKHWGFEGWMQHDESVWNELLAQARDEQNIPQSKPRILAGDLNAEAIEIARANARRAGVERMLQLYVDDAANTGRHLRWMRNVPAPGLLASNPPYGKRIGSAESLLQTYEALSTAVEALPTGWHVALITPDPGVDTMLGRLPRQRISCFNGPIEVSIRLYETDEPRQTHPVPSLSGTQRNVALANQNSAQFAARFRKACKERVRWAAREHISCFRVYDADLPDYPYTIDLYEGSGNDAKSRYVRIEESSQRRRKDAEQAQHNLCDAMALAAAILDAPANNIVFASKDDQPERRDLPVREGNVQCLVDLQRPNATLPLHLREVRKRAGGLSKGGRVACLFAASATTLAQVARTASGSVTVDSSKSHLDAAERMLRMNGIAGKHRFICADVRSWLVQEARAHHSYELILCTPPSWLPAHGNARDWDLQRDAEELVTACGQILQAGGTLLLAPADANVSLNAKELANLGLRMEDVSAHVVPHDFLKSRPKPQCLLFTNASKR